jgi:PiT family inorganic phosphate transporter
MVLAAAGWQEDFHVPVWVILSCHAAIAVGTLLDGWRVVRTMGMRVTKLQPVGGFCAESAAAASIIGNSPAGIPVSTTHTITGGIIGVDSVRRLSAVRWGVAANIALARLIAIISERGSDMRKILMILASSVFFYYSANAGLFGDDIDLTDPA